MANSNLSIPALPVLALGCTGLLAGCPDKQDDEGKRLYQQLTEAQAELWNLRCECPEAAYGDLNTEECLEQYGSYGGLSPAEDRCIADELAGDDKAIPWLECNLEAAEDFAACFAGLECEDRWDYGFAGGATAPCYEAQAGALDECPLIPFDTLNRINVVCLGQPEVDPFTCDDGEQIPEDWECDFEEDCADGSDEVDCEGPGGFACGDGEIIPQSYVCDFEEDCADGSDEVDCDGTFMCGSGENIPEGWVCDGEADCADSSDEQNCLSQPSNRPDRLRKLRRDASR